jgi:hypothetical protein
MRIRDPRSFKPRIRDLGIKKFGSGIRNKHPGSATLLARPKRRTELHLGISGEVPPANGLLSVYSVTTVHVVAYTC